MSLGLNLDYVHKQFNRGDITVVITWLFSGSDRHGAQPCMVIKRNITSLNSTEWTPIAITLDNAYRWEPETWDEGYALLTAQGFADSLGFNPTSKQAVLGIVGVINDHLSDLLTCPPAPRLEERTVAIAQLSSPDTGTVSEMEIKTR